LFVPYLAAPQALQKRAFGFIGAPHCVQKPDGAGGADAPTTTAFTGGATPSTWPVAIGSPSLTTSE
jgi:hypothetical protein